MNSSADTIHHVIPANKFYPPRLDQSRLLPRHWIITDRLPRLHSKNILIIEAQAGQGKTTLAHQFLEHSRLRYTWYQIGPEDNDPVLLLSALLLALCRTIDGFSSPQLAARLTRGSSEPVDLQACVNLLLHEVDARLTEEHFIVFDDMHLIAGSCLTGRLFDYLIDSSPPRLHFILTSRQPLRLEAQALIKNPFLVHLKTADLALSLTEIEELFGSILKRSISPKEAKNIYRITHGWIMGILLSAGSLNAHEPTASDRTRFLPTAADSLALSYFDQEIFAHLPQHLHTSIMQLALCAEIDAELARLITGVSDIIRHLDWLASENFFVYRLDNDRPLFRFHYLFQEYLQGMAHRLLNQESIAATYRLAANYYLAENQIPKALEALHQGEDFSRMEWVLQECGLGFVAAGRTADLQPVLQSIPEKTILEHGWLAYFSGLLAIDSNPRQSLPFFLASRSLFSQSGNETGELVSLAQLIYYHFVISGRYHTGSQLLDRGKTLFTRTYLKMPTEVAIIVACNLACGFCFFDGKMDTARHFAQLACDLACRRGSKNFIAGSRFILGYIGLLSGDRRITRCNIEESFSLAHDPLVSMSNRLCLHILQLAELSMHGDHLSFQRHKEMLGQNLDRQVVRQSLAVPSLSVWSAISLLASGQAAKALDVIEQGMSSVKSASTEHMTSQFLQWRAFAHALAGNRTQALLDSGTAGALRASAGGLYYTAFNKALKGATLAVLGNYASARSHLREGLLMSAAIPSSYSKACCLAYLAYLDCAEGEFEAAKLSLREWLCLMEAEEYQFFWGWEPGCMAQLLCHAVRLNIKPEVATHLARSRLGLAILPEGKSIPLLAINILGGFSIGAGGRILFNPQDLSAHQRELIGLLVAMPGQCISQEQVQLTFWPDSPPDKARNAFDTLLTRLRKLLSKKLPVHARNYIALEKGYLHLKHTRIDAVHFLKDARTGLRLCRQGLTWQAGNTFTSAFAQWKNILPVETFSSDPALAFSDEISNTMRQVCLVWSRRLAERGCLDEALDILEKTRYLLQTDEDCIALRYDLLLKKHQPLKAHEVLASYRQELLRLDYSESEADEVVAALTDRASGSEIGTAISIL